MWGCDWAHITPDIMVVGKSLTRGVMTLSAMMTTKNISDTISNSDIGVLMHGPTFMGNPLSCAVANASIELLLNSSWEKKVKNIETIFKQELIPLGQLDIVEDVRCIGAIGVIELKSDKYTQILQDSCVKNGVWLRPFGKLLYSIVSYNITNDELKQITTAIKDALFSLSHNMY
jgi:adenosylmethionine-8-amino-7-oxononanoate aminotransferase